MEGKARVLIENPTHEEFLAARRNLITGTDIANILGLGYGSAYNTALEKKGLVPPREENEAMWLGKQSEPIALALFERRTKRRVRGSRAIYVHSDVEWIGGTPDGFAIDPDEGLEAKAVGARATRNWGEDGSEDVPADYWTQCQWYAGLFRLDWRLVALMGTKAQIHPIPFNPDLYAGLVLAAKDFREKYLLTDAMPEPTASDLDTVARLYPRSEEAELVETPEIRALIDVYAKVRRDFILAKAAKEDAEAKVKALMGEKSRIVGTDFKVSWKNTKDKVIVDFEAAFDAALKRLPAKYADELQKALVAATRTVPGSRRFLPSGELFKGDE